VGLKSLKSLNLTNGYPNKNKKNKKNNNNNKVKSKPLELFELAGKKEKKKIMSSLEPLCRRTYHTIFKLADHALFKMVRYVFLRPQNLPKMPWHGCQENAIKD
jgi:hypothetical protein